MPRSRRRTTAASMSPFVSCSARLQSIIGAPVWSRSSLTSAAEISAIGASLLRDAVGGRRGFGHLLLARAHLFVVTLRHGLPLLFTSRAVRRGRREVGGSGLLL